MTKREALFSHSIGEMTNLGVTSFHFSFELIDPRVQVTRVRSSDIDFADETSVDDTRSTRIGRPSIAMTRMRRHRDRRCLFRSGTDRTRSNEDKKKDEQSIEGQS